VDVLPGKVKVNFPCRVAFHVPSQGDSKTVLTVKGAEQLMGKGDAFAILPGMSGLTRIHTPHCKEEDIRRILRASISVGHRLRVPAEMTEKEMAALEKDLTAEQKAKLALAQPNKSIADLLDNAVKPQVGGKERVN